MYLLFRFQMPSWGCLSLCFIRMLAVVFYLSQIFPEVKCISKVIFSSCSENYVEEQLECN